MQQPQKYPELKCKKVNKAKTTTFKLYDEKNQTADHFEKLNDNFENPSRNQSYVNNTNTDFSYLQGTRNGNSKQKSFEQIMAETRKFLELKRKMQEDQKLRQKQKLSAKHQKKAKKQQKKDKKVKNGKSKKKSQHQTQVQENIQISDLDIEKFDTENRTIKNIIQKIKLLQNLNSKVSIVEPWLRNIDREQNEGNQNQSDSGDKPSQTKQKINLNQLQMFEVEIGLLQKNLHKPQDSKQILTLDQIRNLAAWSVNSKNQGTLKKTRTYEDRPLIRKYFDQQNEEAYAQQLEDQLQLMEIILFNQENNNK